MRRIAAALLLCVGLGTSPLAGQVDVTPDGLPVEPGSELRVWLVTAGPGDAVWERFGHNALRVQNTSTGRDVAYNWGIFDFDQVDFIPRFLKGQMLYAMAPFRGGPMVEAYARTGRQVVTQELALTPTQRLALRDFAERNALPENRDYFYDYFLDNCSTRVRDLLDQVLGGTLSRRFVEAPTGTSFRFHIRRLTRTAPLLYTGMDVLLGNPGDRPISVWEEMFLPMTLRDAVRDITVVDANGVEGPLVIAEDVVAPGTGPSDPEAPPSWFAAYLLLGLLLGSVLAWSGVQEAKGARWGRYVFGGAGTLWSLMVGLVGTIFVLVLFTDHRFMAWNENLFLLNPLSLALAVLVPLAMRRPRARTAARRLAATVLGIAAMGLLLQPLPFFRQENAIFFALAMPVHLGLWWALAHHVAKER